MNFRQREMHFFVSQEIAKIMGDAWWNRPFKTGLLSVQVRHMANWKPQWYLDELGLVETEIVRINELADIAEKSGI